MERLRLGSRLFGPGGFCVLWRRLKPLLVWVRFKNHICFWQWHFVSSVRIRSYKCGTCFCIEHVFHQLFNTFRPFQSFDRIGRKRIENFSWKTLARTSRFFYSSTAAWTLEKFPAKRLTLRPYGRILPGWNSNVMEANGFLYINTLSVDGKWHWVLCALCKVDWKIGFWQFPFLLICNHPYHYYYMSCVTENETKIQFCSQSLHFPIIRFAQRSDT